MDFVKLYREIGKNLHEWGAYRAVLLSSKPVSDGACELKLEIAVDGEIDISRAAQECAKKWSNIQIMLLDLNDYENEELLRETMEDGIRL